MKEYGIRDTVDLGKEDDWVFIPAGGTLGAVPYRITVPGGGWYNQGFDCDSGIYEKWITIPDTGQAQVIKLEFEAINFISEIYLGKNRGNLEHIQTTASSWMPVVIDITEYVEPGNRYLLRIHVKGREACSVLNKCDREYYVPEGTDWVLTMDSGILRGAYLRLYPAVYVEDVLIKTSVSKDLLEADISVKNHSRKSIDIEMRYSLSNNSPTRTDYPHMEAEKYHIRAGELLKITAGPVTWGLGKDSYWWPNVPYKSGYRAILHEFTTGVWIKDEEIDARNDQFGFREFSYEGKFYYLNGIRCNLRGHNQTEADFNRGTNHCNDAYSTWPGFLPPSEHNGGWPKAVDNYLRLNSNVIRIHQIPPTRYMLDVCDEMGLMVIEESSIRGGNNTWTYQYENQKLGYENMCKQVKDMICRDRNHPCIIMWSIANEPWVCEQYSDKFIYDLNNTAEKEDDTRIKVVDGAISSYDGKLIAIKHYWPPDSIVEWEDKPNGIGEYGNMVTEEGILNVVMHAIYFRLNKEIVDIRPWHLTHAWSAHIPGTKNDNIYNEHNSTIYKKKDIAGDKDFDHLTKYVKSCREVVNQIACKNAGKKAARSVYMDDEEPWNNHIIKLLQKMFNPVAAFDREFWVENIRAGEKNHRFIIPEVRRGEKVCRTITVFNDTFGNEEILFKWEARLASPEGDLISGEEKTLSTLPGESVEYEVQFDVPRDTKFDKIYILLYTFMHNVRLFEEKDLWLRINP